MPGLRLRSPGWKTRFHLFYEAIMEARGITTAQREKDELLAEYKDSDELKTLQELLEDYAICDQSICGYFGTGMLEDFTDSYQGEMSGAEFAQQYTKTADGHPRIRRGGLGSNPRT